MKIKDNRLTNKQLELLLQYYANEIDNFINLYATNKETEKEIKSHFYFFKNFILKDSNYFMISKNKFYTNKINNIKLSIDKNKEGIKQNENF